MNQELYFSNRQWHALMNFAAALDDVCYCPGLTMADGDRERFSLALRAATYNLDCDVHDPEFFRKIARGIRRLPLTDKVTVYGNGAEDFGVHVIQAVSRMVFEKIKDELNRTGLWRRLSYEFCYRPCGTDFLSHFKEGDSYPLVTVRFTWNEKNMSQSYDCAINDLLIWLAKVPNGTKINKAAEIFKPFLRSICCTILTSKNDPSRRGWWGKNDGGDNEKAGS